MTRHHLRTVLLPALALLASGSLAAACMGSGTTVSTVHPGPSASPAGSTASPGAPAATGGVKAPLTGLIDMGNQYAYQHGQPFPTTDPSSLDAYAGAFSGIVVNESWSQLEPSPGVEDWAPLDQSLAAVQSWNDQHPSTPLGVKLRIFAGYSAPSWVVSASGPTVTIVNRHNTKNVGRWWTTPFRQAWDSFQHALAARYDTNPLVREVSVSSCSSSTGEPFVVSGAKLSRQALAAAGWTTQLQESCLDGALADYSGWNHTPITFAFNSLSTPSGPSATFTDQVMRACAGSEAAGGPDCIIGNNDLSATAPSGTWSSQTYAGIAALTATSDRPGVYFQTVGAPVDCSAMAVATTYHAGSVELWPPAPGVTGFGTIPVATLSAWNTALRAGTAITC